MISKIAFSLFIFLVSQNIFAGDKVGNGGGLWTCSVNEKLQQGLLVDLYEAEVEFNLSLITTTQIDPMSIVEERRLFVQNNLQAFYYNWNKVLNEAFSKIHYVDSELTIIDDALFRLKPLSSTCSSGWLYTQFANFTNQDQILIRSDLWNNTNIKPTHKAALIWHEIIYSWLREQYQDKDSVRARQIVGLLFSKLPAQEIESRIQKILSSQVVNPNQPIWICMINNNMNFLKYSNYGLNKLEASVNAIQACKNAPFGFHCNVNDIVCEEIIDHSSQKVCHLENYHNNKSYLGKGRNLLEAEFKAREQCQNDEVNQAVHCGSPVSCQ